DQDVSLSMPLEPTLLNESELVHYYVNTQADKENDATLETDEVEVTREIHDEAFERNKDQRTLSKFLKLPMERVKQSSRSISDVVVRLSRESQLITTDQYMELLMEKEKRKKEIAELKERKREQMLERAAERIVERERKDKEKLEKEFLKQTKEQQRLKQR
ncbi:hypothetical protein KI387_015878, partial [Taxus chinensis]